MDLLIVFLKVTVGGCLQPKDDLLFQVHQRASVLLAFKRCPGHQALINAADYRIDPHDGACETFGLWVPSVFLPLSSTLSILDKFVEVIHELEHSLGREKRY